MFSSSKDAIEQVETEAEKYLLFDSLLFRTQMYHDEQDPVLGICESCICCILALYHNSLCGTHKGSLRTFLTTQQIFLYPI